MNKNENYLKDVQITYGTEKSMRNKSGNLNLKKKISKDDESDSDLSDGNDLEMDSGLKNIKKSMGESIFIAMKTRDLQIGMNERRYLLPERRESGLLNKREMNDIDNGFKIMKNTQNIKENKNIIKICDLLKNLCLLYIKTGSCLEIPNFKSFYN